MFGRFFPRSFWNFYDYLGTYLLLGALVFLASAWSSGADTEEAGTRAAGLCIGIIANDSAFKKHACKQQRR